MTTMRIPLWRAALFVFGLACCGLAASAPQDSGPGRSNTTGATFRIAGTAVSAAGGSPLARARVSIFDTKNPENTQWMITAEDGRFEFNQLPPGKYSLQGAKRGFIRTGYEQHEEYSTAIVTGAGVDTEHLVLRLPPVAVLTGKVLDEAGEPVRNAMLWLYREDRRAGVSRIVRFRNTLTDDQGAYDLTPLDAGTYFLSVRAQPWYAVYPPVSADSKESGNPPADVDLSLDVAYPVTYYSDATDSDDATPIPIRGGDHLQIDLHLNPVPALHLLFHSSDKGGTAFPTLTRSAFGGEEVFSGTRASMVSPGVYAMTGLPAGRYRVRVPGANWAGMADEIEVTQDRQQVDLSRAEAAPAFKATLQVEGQTTIPPHLGVFLRNSKLRAVDFQEVNAKGEVEFHGLTPGQYQVQIQSPDKRYSVVRISSSSGATSGQSLNVTGAPLTVSLTLAAGDVKVEGVVRHAGKPAARAMVVLVPKNPEANHDLFRRDQSDLDGTFSLAAVVPGSYTICAIENGWDLDWARPGVIAHYCRRGKPVTVSSHATGTIHLTDTVELQPK